MSDTQRPAPESYRTGQLQKPAHRRAMAAFASSELRLTGLRAQRRMRDAGIAFFRTAILLAAVLLPNLNPQEPPAGDAPDIQIYNTPEVQSSQPINLSVRVDADQAANPQALGDTRISIYEPITFKRAGETVDFLISAKHGAWYRTELGEGDVFWALPNGDFFFKVKSINACTVESGVTMNSDPISKQVCEAELDFEFDTQSSARVGETGSQPPGLVSCDQGKLALVPGQSRLKCTYANGSKGVTVLVKPSVEPTQVKDKVAFDVKWCPSPTECSEN